MGTEIPSFQVEIYEIYNHDSVTVLAFNYNSNVIWLDWYASTTGLGLKNPDVPITFPFLFDSTYAAFAAYETPDDPDLLPTIFLLDQNGLIHIRKDNFENDFDNVLNEIITTVDDLLANPPEPTSG